MREVQPLSGDRRSPYQGPQRQLEAVSNARESGSPLSFLPFPRDRTAECRKHGVTETGSSVVTKSEFWRKAYRTTFFSTDAILAAAKIPSSALNQGLIAHKIWDDGLVCKRAFELAAESFKLEAIRQLTQPERDALHRRLGLPVAPPKEKVTWKVTTQTENGIPLPGGETRIEASVTGERTWFTGAPENACLMEFRGERVPAVIVEEYRRSYRGPEFLFVAPAAPAKR